jgi:hypothetical protein
MVTPLQVLKTARKLIAKKEGWTKGTCARNRSGVPVDWDESSAVSFCAYGAIYRAAIPLDSAGDRVHLKAEDFLKKVIQRPTIQFWNDEWERTKKEVLAAFDQAIANASKKTTKGSRR